MPMRSIERHLSSWVLGVSGLGALLLGAVAYLVILGELNEAFDKSLEQVAIAIADHDPVADPPVARRAPRDAGRADDTQIVITLWTSDHRRTFSSDPAVELPFVGRSGLSRQRVAGVDWDVQTLVRPDVVVQAAQQAAVQEQEAAESAARLLLPFGAVIAVLGLLMIHALRRGLRPLDATAVSVAARSASSLAPIAEQGMPREVLPLVRAINDLLHRLGSAFAAQRVFVADAAHELRTPVTALRLQLQLLESAPDEDARRAATAELRAGVERAQHLIEQLLHLSRMEPGADVQRIETLALDELVRDTVARLSVKAEHLGIDLGARAGATLLVRGDRNELTVLLGNLVDNALRYTPRGGVVDVVAEHLDGVPTLRVIDNGPGIVVADREHVFDRFRRAENAPLSPHGETGSGLGLSIVRAIAERHSAHVSLHTAPAGRGLEVRVVFAPRSAAG